MRRCIDLIGFIALLGCALPASIVAASHPGSAAGSSSTVVLGSKSYYAPAAHGFGTVKPGEIFNGGDPSGMVSGIVWQQWGQKSAIGWGYTWIFKPQGGYYPNHVRAELRATDIGRCSPGGPLAYRRLYAREPARPGGPLKAWFAWSGTGNICRSP